MPPFTWESLERQLLWMAAGATQAMMVNHLVSAARKTAAFLPPEAVLQEILCIAASISDGKFPPRVREEEDPMRSP